MPRIPKPFEWRGGYYTDLGGTRRKLTDNVGAAALAEARRKLTKLIVDQDEGRIEKPGCQFSMRLKQLIDLYGEAVKIEGKLSEATIASYRWHLKLLVKRFGNPLVTRITSKEAKAYRLEMLKQGYSHALVNTHTTICKLLYNWGIDNDHLPQHCNPFRRMPRGPAKRRNRLMTPQEFELIMQHCPDHDIRDALIMLRYTPARPSDLRRAEWSMIQQGGELLVLPYHKTVNTSQESKPRVIYLPEIVQQMLAERRLNRPESKYVFTKHNGKPLSRNTICIAFAKIREKAGITVDEAGEALVPYSNRHTIITQAVRKGVTGPQLQVLGGWTNLITAKHYVHLAETDVVNIGKIAAEAITTQTKGDNGGKTSEVSG